MSTVVHRAVRCPDVSEIFREPRPSLLDILSAPDMASGVRAGYEMAKAYQLIAQELLTALNHTIRERDELRAEIRALRRG